jgi:SAM-dependent methyltransferase
MGTSSRVITGLLATISVLLLALGFSQSRPDRSLSSLLSTTSCYGVNKGGDSLRFIEKNCSQECQPAYREMALLKQTLAKHTADLEAEKRRGGDAAEKLQKEIDVERRESAQLVKDLKQVVETLRLELNLEKKNATGQVRQLQAELEKEKQKSRQLAQELENERKGNKQRDEDVPGNNSSIALAFTPPLPSDEDVRRDVDLVQNYKLLGASPTEKDWNKRRRGIFPKKDMHAFVEFCATLAHPSQESLQSGQIAVPPEVLAEAHHNYYGAPWALGRDVFEFFVNQTNLKPHHRVLDVGCGSLRVGIHFISYLEAGHYACIEADALSLAAGLLYEVPVHGLLQKRPQAIHSKTFDTSSLSPRERSYDLIYASAVLIHVETREQVWDALGKFERLLVPGSGRLFISHNMKWCEAPGAESDCPMPGMCDAIECPELEDVNLRFVAQHASFSRLFNWEERWFEFESMI